MHFIRYFIFLLNLIKFSFFCIYLSEIFISDNSLHEYNLLFTNLSLFLSGLQLVLLDHGMYRRADPVVRQLYCQLWKALLTQDEKLGKEACRNLGVDVS